MNIDIEVVLAKVEATLRAKFNDHINAINADKNDGIVLKNVSDKAYIFQSLDEKVANYNPFVYYGIDSTPTTGTYMALAKTLKIEVSVILADQEDGALFKKILRYQKALENLFTSEIFPIQGLNEKVVITSLEPVSFKLQNSTSEFKAIGVIIELELFS